MLSVWLKEVSLLVEMKLQYRFLGFYIFVVELDLDDSVKPFYFLSNMLTYIILPSDSCLLFFKNL